MRPDLSIIIVCYRGHKQLKQCLDSLVPLQGEKLKTEVIVVNNCLGDSDFNTLVKSYPDFHCLENTHNWGYGHGCNLGATLATGMFYLILNPDTIVTENAVVELVDILKSNPAITAVSCKQVDETGKESIAWGSFPDYQNLTWIIRLLCSAGPSSQLRRKEGFSSKIFFPDWISGSAIMIRSADYHKLNGFDESFWMYYEDVDFCRRIRASGGEIAFCTHISIKHHHGGSSRINLKIASITKAEALISSHIYISKHTIGFQKILIHTFQTINNTVSLAFVAVLGVAFFFVPQLFLRVLIFGNILLYYLQCLIRTSWASPRSINICNK